MSERMCLHLYIRKKEVNNFLISPYSFFMNVSAVDIVYNQSHVPHFDNKCSGNLW